MRRETRWQRVWSITTAVPNDTCIGTVRNLFRSCLHIKRQSVHNLLPRTNRSSGVLFGNIRPWIRHCPREQLHGHLSLVPQSIEICPRHLFNCQISSPLALVREASCNPRPRHSCRPVLCIISTAFDERRKQSFRINKLDVEYLCHVHDLHKFFQRSIESFVCVRNFAIETRRVRPDTACYVESVEAHAKIRAVNPSHDLPRVLPRINVRSLARSFYTRSESAAIFARSDRRLAPCHP